MNIILNQFKKPHKLSYWNVVLNSKKNQIDNKDSIKHLVWQKACSLNTILCDSLNKIFLFIYVSLNRISNVTIQGLRYCDLMKKSNKLSSTNSSGKVMSSNKTYLAHLDFNFSLN